jgi:hypothetical protein
MCPGWNRAACSGKANAGSKRSRRYSMQCPDAHVFYRGNQRNLVATHTMDIPEHAQALGTKKQAAQMRPPQWAKVFPFEFRLAVVATWRF